MSSNVESIGILEVVTIHEGFGLVDAMAKEASIEILAASPIPPGRFLIIIGGSVGEVESSWRRGLGLCAAPHDQLFLAEVAPAVLAAAARSRQGKGGSAGAGASKERDPESLGLFETSTVAACFDSADRVVKGTAVRLECLHVARGIAGKSFGLVQGRQDMVEAALALAEERARAHEGWIGSTLLARPDPEVAARIPEHSVGLPGRAGNPLNVSDQPTRPGTGSRSLSADRSGRSLAAPEEQHGVTARGPAGVRTGRDRDTGQEGDLEEARVVGTVVATQAVSSMGGVKLVWIDPLDDAGRPTGRFLVAADVTQSGPGSTVFFVRSREAAEALEDPFCPVDAAVIGIVDASNRGSAGG